MRIPVWLATLLGLITVALTWRYGTRGYDFLGPLAEIADQQHGDSTQFPATSPDGRSLAEIDAPHQAPPAPLEFSGPPAPSPAAPLPLPVITHDDPGLPPALDAYLLDAPLGSAELAARAAALERNGQWERALLAWERVLDSGHTDLSWRPQARAAVRRLRGTLPPWNQDPAKTIPLVIQIGADIRFGDTLETAATLAAAQITGASSGLLSVESVVTLGEAAGPESEALPVAVWITDAANPPASSTQVLSFTSPPEPPSALSRRILATIYDLVRTHLEEDLGFPPFPLLDGNGDPFDALETALTRRAWEKFAKSLQGSK